MPCSAACDEIKQRIDFNILIEVSTIHSFAWSLIHPYHRDIRDWLRSNLQSEIAELQAAQAKGRAGTKAAAEREASIANKTERLAHIETVKKFVYSPTGDNRGRDALNHSEVISITAAFLGSKPTLQRILISQYPILLVDESQDTNRSLMEALLAVQQLYPASFCVGLFGDMMQRIYLDGKPGLPDAIPEGWTKPVKQMNHRCPGRILELLNRMRGEADGQQQQGRTDKPQGFVRFFLFPSNVQNKQAAEVAVAKSMADIAGDEMWANEYKALILEHHMAAKRLGFSAMFEPLYKVDSLRNGLLDGSLPALRFFTGLVLPLVEAMRREDRFAGASVVRKYSPLVEAKSLKSQKDQLKQLESAKRGVDDLMELWKEGHSPSFGEVLHSVARSGLFPVPDVLRVIASRAATESSAEEAGAEAEREKPVAAWDEVMATPFEQAAMYDRYISGRSAFDTHQGVKGREFPRVMVLVDDEDARGFLFSYEKLFGVKDKSDTDKKNEQQGLETTIDRTRRLFYVTCSRAEKSLAIVAYTSDPEKAKSQALEAGWFAPDEVIVKTGA